MTAPWKTIGWSPEHIQSIYREWGLFYTKQNNLHTADYYYDKSLELMPTDAKALYFRSKCKRSIAKTEQALEDAWTALKIDPLKQPYNIEVCDGVYQMNQFEKNKVLLHNFSRKFIGAKVQSFYKRLDVVEEDFKCSIGESLGRFALYNRKAILKAHERIEKSRHVDPRPLWKILKDQQKCDVLSTLEVIKPMLSPMEIARRFLEFRVYNQMYLGRSWKDVLYLRSLRNDEQLISKESQYSSKLFELITTNKYATLLKFLKMLQCRSPLYNKMNQAFPNKKLRAEMKEAFLYRVQYQTHRTYVQILKKMNELRKAGQLINLRRYVEKVMSEFTVVKTFRVLPCKFEFINEVYNLYALALIDYLLKIPRKIMKIRAKDRLRAFLKLPKEVTERVQITFEFGNRATASDVDATSKITARYRAIELRLEKRLYFAKYPIERAYLFHELANLNLIQLRFDKCYTEAQKCIKEAKLVRSNVWIVLGIMIMVKAHTMLKKLARIRKALSVAAKVAKKMKASKRLRRFIRRASLINRAAITAKRLADRMRRKLSRQLMHSRSNSQFNPAT